MTHYQQQPTQPIPQQPWQPPKPKKRRTVLIVFATLAGVFVVGVGGCVALVGLAADSGDNPSKVVGASTPTTAPTAQPTTQDTEPPAVSETSEAPDDNVAKIGATEWFTYEDGLKVQVTKARPYKIGEYAAGGKPGGQGVVITVTIRNGGSAVFDSDLADVELASGPNGDQAERVFDSATDGLGFTGSIAPGRSKTAKFAFAVPKSHLSQLQIEVTPSWEHNGCLFEGAAKK